MTAASPCLFHGSATASSVVGNQDAHTASRANTKRPTMGRSMTIDPYRVFVLREMHILS